MYEKLKEIRDNNKYKSKYVKSLIRGLVYITQFIKSNKRCTKQIFTQYILCLTILLCNQRSPIRNVINDLIEYELIRMSKKWSEIHKSDSIEIYDYGYIFFACTKIKDKTILQMYKKLYKRYMKKKSDRDTGIKGTAVYDDIDSEYDYDYLNDEITDHLFLYLSKQSGITFLPPDNYKEMMKIQSKMDYDTILDAEGKDFDEFSFDTYFATHVIYSFTCYGCKKRPKRTPKYIERCVQYLHDSSDRIYKYASRDIDLLAETLECMVSMKHKPWIKKYKQKFIRKLLSSQKRDGSWSNQGDKGCYEKFHGTWTCLNALNTLL